MSYIQNTKWGICSNCGGKEQEVIKVKKDLFCISCRNAQKAQEQVTKSNRRNAARRVGFKLRNSEIPPIATEEYGQAERQNLINDLDYVASRICRMIGSDDKGICQCYTCPTKRHFSLMQAGHYISRKFTQLRFDLRWNLRPQCPTCNEAKHGNLEVFAEKLEQEQTGITAWLQELSREQYKYSRDELKTLLIDMRQKLRIIETKFQTNKTT